MKKIIKGERAAPPPPQRQPLNKNILQREVVGAELQARQIINEAENKAQRIIDDATEQAQETHQRGYEEGRQEALAQFTEQITQALLQVERMNQELEPLYIGLVRTCVERIIDGELRLHGDAIVGVVRNALRDARQQREIMVRVHPADADSLTKNKARLLEMLARAQTIEIRADESIRRGGCVVTTELGTIDASLERQLEALENALLTELEEGGAYVPDSEGYDEESELDSEDDPGYGQED